MPAAPAGEPQLKCEFKDNDSDMIVSHVADAFLLVTTDTNTGNEIETTCSNRSRADLNSIGLLLKRFSDSMVSKWQSSLIGFWADEQTLSFNPTQQFLERTVAYDGADFGARLRSKD